ncbi:copper-translocating P-type ATPase [Helicobacter sp. TUL]|uniref:heavy metal translocating P-type ATPase n=1 Tax=Helicobacter sp. TUL TaxID=1848928 RepID=UPI000BAB52FD|nr:heavy metal translocating P-type ATPase [Helicobacter sp. TUL]PAV00979.1 copper-translocating P-type ATPase [Helicobacter sp. TUL]
MLRHCSHCHIAYEEHMLKKVPFNGEDLYFCCNGCEGVYMLLQKADLGSFYTKRGDVALTPPTQDTQDLSFFDSPSFAQKYIRTDSKNPNLSSCALILTHIHCAACVWLNEQVLNSQKGIKSASINYTNNRLYITWDSQIITLSQIIRLIQSIGYDAYAYDPQLQENADKKQTKDYYTRVIVALFCTMNIMWIAVAQYSGYFLGIEAYARNVLNIASFILCSLTLFYAGFVFYRGAYYGLKNGFIGMDMLVAVGSTLTYCYSIYAAITHSGETYFESVSMIITFVLIGKFLEVRSKKSAGENLEAIYAFLPQNITICKNGDERTLEIKKPQEVQIGDVIMSLPGEKIAIDGILLSQKGLFDTKAINGESMPLELQSGQEVISGSINLTHKILYKATKSFNDSLMSKLLNLVEQSLAHKPSIQNLANSISQNFSRTILAIALLCFMGWYVLSDKGAEGAMIIAISVIIIACPCALALATPIATIIGISQGYKKHILFRQANFLETLAKIDTIVFDKTGTLTMGKPQVCATHTDLLDSLSISLLYTLTHTSKHPISLSVCEYIRTYYAHLNPNLVHLQSFQQIDSKGVCGYYEGELVLGGSLAFLQEQGVRIPALELGEGMMFGFAKGRELVAVFELQDSPKPYAKELIAYLQSQHIHTILLSGDRVQSVQKCAKELGISEYHAEFSPLDKGAYIENLKAKTHRVVMVGDGINDALALSKSDIAISMGAGSDIAILSSDVIILDDSLQSVQNALHLAKITFKTIKQNILLSIIYNALTIPIAICGLIIPLFAALSMSLSSIIVVLNSLRIKSQTR